MRKTLQDAAKHLKNLMPPQIPETYAIKPMFEEIASAESIRAGILAFRDFMHSLYDNLIADGDAYDNKKKIAHAFDNRSAVSVHYPFLNHIERMLSSMGLTGTAENTGLTVSGSGIFNPKLSAPKNIEVLRFLASCNICFDGIDLSAKKPDLPNTETIKITYPHNPAMLTGLRAMAIAQQKFMTNDNFDILLRCDYRVLKDEPTEAEAILKDTIAPLTPSVQDYLLKLHQRYLDKGLSCDIKAKDLWVKIYYSYKKREIWAINASLNNGYQISVKAENADKYADTVKNFPQDLQEMIARGYGCGKKRGISSHCDGGCRGLRVALDESVLDISRHIEAWFDHEIECL